MSEPEMGVTGEIFWCCFFRNGLEKNTRWYAWPDSLHEQRHHSIRKVRSWGHNWESLRRKGVVKCVRVYLVATPIQ